MIVSKLPENARFYRPNNILSRRRTGPVTGARSLTDQVMTSWALRVGGLLILIVDDTGRISHRRLVQHTRMFQYLALQLAGQIRVLQ